MLSSMKDDSNVMYFPNNLIKSAQVLWLNLWMCIMTNKVISFVRMLIQESDNFYKNSDSI